MFDSNKVMVIKISNSNKQILIKNFYLKGVKLRFTFPSYNVKREI